MKVFETCSGFSNLESDTLWKQRGSFFSKVLLHDVSDSEEDKSK